MSSIARFDEKYAGLADRLNDCYYTLEDISFEISSLAGELIYDEREVDAVEDRIDAIHTLKRKYGEGIPAILSYLEKAKAELERLEKSEEIILALNKQMKRRTKPFAPHAQGSPRRARKPRRLFAKAWSGTCGT
jgi:DNA repair protein RecN (Recombination protein N)